MKSKFLIYIIILLINSCELNETRCCDKKNDKQVIYKLNYDCINKNEIKVDFFYESGYEISLGDPLVLKISNNNYKIVESFFDCEIKDTLLVDIKSKQIHNCDKKLFLENDTIIIYFEPTRLGKHNFHNITILLKDSLENYFIVDTTFSYKVVQPNTQKNTKVHCTGANRKRNPKD